jgi:hypothetical protein
MARRLKVFETSLGFFDLAIAAPSMKAALQAWGAGEGRNLFHDGVAKESSDPKVVAAAMATPGVVLRRPVGSTKPFREHADLPVHLGRDLPGDKQKPAAKPKKARRSTDGKAERKAALAFERAQVRQELQRRKRMAAEAKHRERRDRAIAKAAAALERGEREHETIAASIEAQRESIEKKSQGEETRWRAQKEKLGAALRRARDA